MATSLTAAGSAVIVHRDLQPIGRVWWNAMSERWHAETADGDPIDEHPLRAAAIDLVAEEPCWHRSDGDHPSLEGAASGA
ncbi:hypothetical protein ACFV1N_25225 [Streptosporangium canum]|uniref:hypothetical protein n=1 Tax=Streptosporangium canum TaxID=324952 RepID=UPI0036800BBD